MSSEARLQQLQADHQALREKSALLEVMAVNAETEFFEQKAILLLDDTRTDIRNIENDIAAVQGTLEGRSYVSIRLPQLQIEIQALRKRHARYERMAENAETPFGLQKALCLKANTNKAIHTIEAQISDLNSEQSFFVSDPLPLAPNVSTDPQNNIVFETLAPVDSRAANKSILISHCWNDKHIVGPIVQPLQANQFNVLFDMGVNSNADLYLLSNSIWKHGIMTLKLLIDDLDVKLNVPPNTPVNISTILAPNPGIDSPPLPYSNPKQYIGCNDTWHSMDNTFRIHKYCVLHGVGGSGKTYAAVKYGYQQMQSGQNVAWLNCDSAANAESSYRGFSLAVSRHPANNGKLTDVVTPTFHQVMNDMIQNDIGRNFLLILDNVEENYKDVEQI
ncbi:hypothetical protein HK100_008006, partial [Physocladia obscura]